MQKISSPLTSPRIVLYTSMCCEVGRYSFGKCSGADSVVRRHLSRGSCPYPSNDMRQAPGVLVVRGDCKGNAGGKGAPGTLVGTAGVAFPRVAFRHCKGESTAVYQVMTTNKCGDYSSPLILSTPFIFWFNITTSDMSLTPVGSLLMNTSVSLVTPNLKSGFTVW